MVCLDIEEGEETVDVAAALLVVVVGAVDADDRSGANGFSLEGKAVLVEGEGAVEG